MTDKPSREGYVPVPGGRVWYRVVGTNDGVPLLLLHGGPGLGSDYFGPLEALSDERPVIRYDQLGGGKSDQSGDTSLWTIERFVEELAQVRVDLNLAPVHILGHSWGTMLAVAYMLTQPADVLSLILSSPVFNTPRFESDLVKLRNQLPADVQQVLNHHETIGTTDSVEYQTAVMEFYRRHLCRLEWLLDIIQEGMTEGQEPPVYQYMWGSRIFTITGPLKEYDYISRLQEIAIPTLFTCGRYDQCTPETTGWYQSLIAGSEMVVFEQSTHMLHLEETDDYLQVVRDFIHSVEEQ